MAAKVTYLVQFIGPGDECLEAIEIEPDEDEDPDLSWDDALEKIVAQIIPEETVRIEIDRENAKS